MVDTSGGTCIIGSMMNDEVEMDKLIFGVVYIFAVIVILLDLFVFRPY